MFGLYFLTIRNELFRFPNEYHNDEFLCWVVTSFFHDIGHGIQEIEKITEKVDEQLKGFGKVISPEFRISESLRLFGEQILKYMNNILVETKDKEDHELSHYSSLLESWEKRNHGIMSAMIMLKKIDEYIVNEPFFSEGYNSERWSNVFLRAALAMTIHTLPKERKWKINVDKTLSDRTIFPYIYEPLFPAFLLTFLDTIEYINRPKFKTSDDGIGTVPVKDIDLTLDIKCNFTETKYLVVDIIARYTDKDYFDLLKTAKNMYLLLHHFCSDKWGVKITLETENSWDHDVLIRMKEINLLPREPVVKLLFLRTEKEEFLSLFKNKLIEYKNKEVGLYSAFFKRTAFQLNIEPNVILRPITTDYETLMTKHFIKSLENEDKFHLLKDFFEIDEIDSFIPMHISMQLLDYLRNN
ncbi:MAG: hypothetical protein ACFE9L_12390 [Candidatus Hodarchaeota archaeon]